MNFQNKKTYKTIKKYLIRVRDDPIIGQWLFIIFVIVYAIAVFWSAATHQPETFRVIEVIDGDTIIIEGERIIRLLGVDTPERYEQGFLETKQALENLILNKQVQIICRGYDKYSRELCWVYLNSQDVAQVMNLIKKSLGVERSHY